MNIFLLTETNSGCYKWRSAIPAKYLRRRGHKVQVSFESAEAPEAPDVMVFYRAHFAEGVKLVEWCKKNGIRVVYDTDDALDLVPPGNLNYKALQARLPLYELMLKVADVVTTTTETLAGHLRQWNPNVVVVPNSVDPEEWSCRRTGGEVRIGWSGSPTHFDDLAVALDAIRELQKKNPFTLVLQGICSEPTLQELYDFLRVRWGNKFFEGAIGRPIKRFMEKLSGVKYEFHPMVPLSEHSTKVCDLALDIGIAPLADNPFNRNKSCIKYYEYAMTGAITVASQVLPYSAEVPTTAKNNREAWKQKLEWALNIDREPVWREQQEWVKAHRNIEKNVELWEQVFAGRSVEATPEREAALHV